MKRPGYCPSIETAVNPAESQPAVLAFSCVRTTLLHSIASLCLRKLSGRHRSSKTKDNDKGIVSSYSFEPTGEATTTARGQDLPIGPYQRNRDQGLALWPPLAFTHPTAQVSHRKS